MVPDFACHTDDEKDRDKTTVYTWDETITSFCTLLFEQRNSVARHSAPVSHCLAAQ